MENVKNSIDVYSSRDVDSSRDVYFSRSVDSSRDVFSSRYVFFCYDIKLKEFYAFNKQVKEERFYEIKKYWNQIKGDFKLELKDNNWSDEWKKLPNEVWKKLSELPEFDKEVVEKIVGFELNLDEPEEMTMEEVCKALGKVIKIKK